MLLPIDPTGNDDWLGGEIAYQPKRRPPIDPDAGWREWLPKMFPSHITGGFAEHHETFWDWAWAIRPAPAKSPPPFAAIWARGGAKSTSAEMFCAACAARETRTYGLYVSHTQDLANAHVGNVQALLESDRFGNAYSKASQRHVGRFGNVSGWRANRLRTSSGFILDAVGLDRGTRGIKVEEKRPDLIILDDIDEPTDSHMITDKKVDAITKTILPTGTEHTVVLAIQNLVHPDGVFAKLASSEPPFLQGRILSGPVPAVYGLLTVKEGGRDVIKAGRPSWQGQNLETCQLAIDKFGLQAFLAESQHEVDIASKQDLVFGADPEDGVLIFDPRLNYAEAKTRWADCKWRIIAIDPGGKDPSMMIALGIDHHERHHVYAVKRWAGGSDVFQWHAQAQEWNELGRISLVFIDTAGGDANRMAMERFGWPAFAANKDRSQIPYVQQLFKTRRLTIAPLWAGAWDIERGSYWWDVRGDTSRHSSNSYATRTGPAHHGEMADCIRYAVTGVLREYPSANTGPLELSIR